MDTNGPEGLIDRIAAGQGDNAEVLRALGFERLSSERSLAAPLDSVDDALRLVPDGWLAEAFQWRSEARPWEWTLTNDRSDENGASVSGRASTAARALTIAILRTKETTNG